MKMIQKKSGQSLIEVSIALSVILLTLTSIAILITSSMSNSTFIKNQTQASKYAQEGMEYIRYLRNNDSSRFFLYSDLVGSWCLDNVNNEDPLVNQCSTPNIGNEYIRTVEFTSGTGVNCLGQIQVNVVVKWQSGKCSNTGTSGRFCHSSMITSCFQDKNTGGL